jgi:hypothetical protein
MTEKVNEMNDRIEIYNEILSVLDKHKDVLENDSDLDIRRRLENRIKFFEILNKFDFRLQSLRPNDFSQYMRLSEYTIIGLYGEDHRRTISWSDDGRQPENEWLYVISFPTGAYIFGEEYPKNSFNEMFEELRRYGPAYSDSHNHNLYFNEHNAKFVHENLFLIMRKYRDLARKEIAEKKIKELEEQLELLKAKGE